MTLRSLRLWDGSMPIKLDGSDDLHKMVSEVGKVATGLVEGYFERTGLSPETFEEVNEEYLNFRSEHGMLYTLSHIMKKQVEESQPAMGKMLEAAFKETLSNLMIGTYLTAAQMPLMIARDKFAPDDPLPKEYDELEDLRVVIKASLEQGKGQSPGLN